MNLARIAVAVVVLGLGLVVGLRVLRAFPPAARAWYFVVVALAWIALSWMVAYVLHLLMGEVAVAWIITLLMYGGVLIVRRSRARPN